MATVTRPCYVTRDVVMRALDVAPSQHQIQRVDDLIMAGSEFVEAECQRHFYPLDATYTFDWPNYQYAYPWRLWLDQYELAQAPAKVVSGTYLAQPVDITSSVIPQPINDGPPYTSIELRRDLSGSFGNNTTPQNDIGITGTFGFWYKPVPAATLAVAMTDTTGTTLTLSAGPTSGPGVGDVILVESERMLLTDISYASTGVTATSGGTLAQKTDMLIGVPDGTQFSAGEVILIEQEFMLITNVVGNILWVNRAVAGSILSTHSNMLIYANRLATVTRGALGTTAATHTQGKAIQRFECPALVRQVATAHALTGKLNEPAGYSVQTTASWYGSNARVNDSQKTAAPGVGMMGLMAQLWDSIYVRKARSRVI